MFLPMSHFAKRNVRRIGTWAALAALLMPAAALAGGLPPGFVYLRDVAPGIAQDMRYAGANNFTGRPLPGYDAAECVLRRAAAEALARVEADLAGQNLGLKVYDCYRPTRAVAAFARWAQAAPTTARPSASTPSSTSAGCSPTAISRRIRRIPKASPSI